MHATKMTSSKPPIGFCGLGAMGFGMATNLVKKGYTVKGFDVFPQPVQRFAGAGGVPASSLADSASGSDFYVVMVATAAQAEQVLWGPDHIVDNLPQNATVILMSTVPSSYSSELHTRLTKHRSDLLFVDSPVSGGAARAAAGTLSLMSSSSNPSGLEHARALLQDMADQKKLYLVEGGAGQGSNMKMVHQVLAGAHILASSEGMGFAAKLGVDPKLVAEKAGDESSPSWCWMFENRTPRMLTEDYYPGVSALTIILKDVGIITTMSRATHFPTPLNSVAEQVYFTGLSQGFGPHDDSSMVRLYYPEPLSTVSNTSSEDMESKLALVMGYYRIVLLVATAESLSFAHHLKLPLQQLLELASTAAGASTMFREIGPEMAKILESSSIDEEVRPKRQTVDDMVTELGRILDAAREVKVPLFLGVAAYEVLLALQRQHGGGGGKSGEASVVRWWKS
jgi:3-hydroxyisobutyrate dehydrogenase